MNMTARLSILLVAVAVAGADAEMQHDGRQLPPTAASLPATPATVVANPACEQGGARALAIVEAASQRMNGAPQPGPGMEVDDSLTHVQQSIAAAQAQLFACRGALPTPLAATSVGAMAGMDHSQMNMDKLPPGDKAGVSAKKPGDAMAGMDYSKMTMGKPPAVAKPARPGGKSAGKPTGAMAGMDHSAMDMTQAAPKTGAAPPPGVRAASLPMNMAERIADPACPDRVGQASAPKSVYQRTVYYFCSAHTRDEFRKDPGAYLKKHPR